MMMMMMNVVRTEALCWFTSTVMVRFKSVYCTSLLATSDLRWVSEKNGRLSESTNDKSMTKRIYE
jgi:hypothetical protein